MELRRRRSVLVINAVLLTFSALMLAGTPLNGTPRSIVALVFFGFSTLLMGALFAAQLRPFQFRIDSPGITVRRGRLRRELRWQDINAIILDQDAPTVGRGHAPGLKLLVAPATGVDLGLPLTAHTREHDGPCAELLDLRDVKEPPHEIVEALTRYGEVRFIDAVQARRDRFADPEFLTVLRGYDRTAVDELVQAGRDALRPGSLDGVRRQGARLEIESNRKILPVTPRGYDREQVDTYLASLCEELARREG